MKGQGQAHQAQSGPLSLVVGFAHTPAGVAALRWALRESAGRHASLRAIHVFDRAQRADWPLELDPEGALRDLRRRTTSQVNAVLTEHLIQSANEDGDDPGDVDGDDPGDVRVSVLQGELVSTLARAAAHGEIVVIGQPQSEVTAGLPSALAATGRSVVVVDEAGHTVLMAPTTSETTHAGSIITCP